MVTELMKEGQGRKHAQSTVSKHQ